MIGTKSQGSIGCQLSMDVKPTVLRLDCPVVIYYPFLHMDITSRHWLTIHFTEFSYFPSRPVTVISHHLIRPRYYGCFQPSSRKLWFVPRNWFFRPALVTLSGHHFITGSTFLSGRSPQAPAQGVINPRLIPKIRMYSHRGKTDTEGSAQLY